MLNRFLPTFLHAVLCIAALVVSTADSPADPNGTADGVSTPLTLTQAISLSADSSPSISVAQQNLAQARAKLGQATAQRGFQLTFNSTASINSADVIQPPPANEGFGTLQNSVTLPLPGSPKLKAAQYLGSLQVVVAEAQLDAARLDMVSQVQAAYYALLKQRALVLVAQQNVDQAQQALDTAQKRFRDGDAPQLDTLKAQGPLATARGALLQASSLESIAVEALNSLLHRDLDASIELADAPPPRAIDLTISQVRKLALDASPDVRAANAAVEAGKAGVKLAALAHTPEFTLQASDTRGNDRTGFSRLDTLQITATIPLRDSGLMREQVNEQKAVVASAEASAELARQKATIAASSAYLSAAAAISQIQPSVDAVSIAQTTLEKTRLGYTAGLNPIVDVLNAQLALNQAKLAREQTIYDATAATATLYQLIGRSAP